MTHPKTKNRFKTISWVFPDMNSYVQEIYNDSN